MKFQSLIKNTTLACLLCLLSIASFAQTATDNEPVNPSEKDFPKDTPYIAVCYFPTSDLENNPETKDPKNPSELVDCELPIMKMNDPRLPNKPSILMVCPGPMYWIDISESKETSNYNSKLIACKLPRIVLENAMDLALEYTVSN